MLTSGLTLPFAARPLASPATVAASRTRPRSNGVSIELWALVAGVAVVLAVVLVVVPVLLRRRSGRRRRVPRFEGKLGNQTRNREFVDFLTRNRHHRVRLDVWMDDADAAADDDRGAPEQIRLVAPSDNPSHGDECEITIRVDDRAHSPLSRAHGVWRLNGYVAVEGLMGVWQGTPSYHLVAVWPKRSAG
jgi:hypothetical protein